MDSDQDYLCNDNMSHELDKIFCGFFSCCANLLKEEDPYDPLDQTYVVSMLNQPVRLVQYVPPNKKSGNIEDPLIILSKTNKPAIQSVFTPTPF